jgi:hypothetical protein
LFTNGERFLVVVSHRFSQVLCVSGSICAAFVFEAVGDSVDHRYPCMSAAAPKTLGPVTTEELKEAEVIRLATHDGRSALTDDNPQSVYDSWQDSEYGIFGFLRAIRDQSIAAASVASDPPTARRETVTLARSEIVAVQEDYVRIRKETHLFVHRLADLSKVRGEHVGVRSAAAWRQQRQRHEGNPSFLFVDAVRYFERQVVPARAHLYLQS